MKKTFISIGAILSILIILIVFISATSGGNNLLTAGEYIYGEDISAQRYMYQLEGPGEVTIKTAAGEESYYKELKEGESIHEHYLPLEEGDSLIITESATVQLI